MNFNHQFIFNMYDEQYQSFDKCKSWYNYSNKLLDAVSYNHAYYFKLNDEMLNLNNNSYKFIDTLYNHTYCDEEICGIFPNINKS